MPSSPKKPPRTQEHHAGAARSELKLRKKTVRREEAHFRKNPNSLRFLIGLIILHMHDGQQDKAAAAFRDASGKYVAAPKNNKKRPLTIETAAQKKEMNSKALTEILSDVDFAQYWHLEAISESLNIPTGALLIMSRMYATLSAGQTAASPTFVDCCRNFVDCLENISKDRDITQEHIAAVMNAFQPLYDLEHVQPRLLD